MRKLSGSFISCALLAMALLELDGCAQKEEPAVVAVAPPPPPPALAPPPPSADGQLHARLAHLGAKPTDGGWTLTLSSAKFRGGKVDFAADEEGTVTTIVSLLQGEPHLRLQVENYIDKRGPKAREQERSQMDANAVLRHLTAEGGDTVRIQTEGRIDTSTASRIEIIFSNAEGEFRPAPVENS